MAPNVVKVPYGEDALKIVVAGASGFLGRALIDSLGDHEVVALTRHGENIGHARSVTWNGLKIDRWADELDGADAVVNYAGSPVTDKWTDENMRLIKETRVQPTYLIGQAIGGAANPPKVWINGSAVGYYGSRGAEMLDETSTPGTGFLADVCRVWEDVLSQESLPSTRRIALRTGIVLGRDGGALKPLVKMTKLFLGGQQGDGHQWMPWIHIDDHVAMVKWLMENEISGPVNAVGPAPCLNSTFMETLRGVLGRPMGIPAPKGLLGLASKVAGPDPEAVLASARVCPKVAQAAGFRWRYPGLESALRNLLREPAKATTREKVSVM